MTAIDDYELQFALHFMIMCLLSYRVACTECRCRGWICRWRSISAGERGHIHIDCMAGLLFNLR